MSNTDFARSSSGLLPVISDTTPITGVSTKIGAQGGGPLKQGIVGVNLDIMQLLNRFDPEIPADIYELCLIYRIDIADDRAVAIDMTLTTPNCPSAQELPTMVENAVASVPGVGAVKVDIVWDPPWDPSRMSDEARAVLNMW